MFKYYAHISYDQAIKRWLTLPPAVHNNSHLLADPEVEH